MQREIIELCYDFLVVLFMEGANMDIKHIAEQAFQLPEAARELLAEALVESLDRDDSFELSDEWKAEIEKRCAEVDQGLTKLIPAEEAIKKLRARYK